VKHRISVTPSRTGRGLVDMRCNCGRFSLESYRRCVAVQAGVNHLYTKLAADGLVGAGEGEEW
jgi:hypothetical protein